MSNEAGNASNFGAICLDFALRVGLVDYASGVPALPDDTNGLALIRSFVNRGYAHFLRDDPNWSFLVQTISVTFDPDGTGPYNVDGDAARYRLPGWVSSRGLNDYVYSPTAGVVSAIKPRAITEIKRLQQGSSSAGYPRLFAEEFVPSVDATPSRPVMPTVVFYPTPTVVRTVSNQYRVSKFVMDADEDLPVCGPEHQDAVLDAAVWLWARHDKEETDPAAVQLALAAYERSLAQSKAIDNKRRGTPLGQMVDACEDGAAPVYFDHTVPLYIEGYRQI